MIAVDNAVPPPPSAAPIIEIESVTKKYGDLAAVRDMTLRICAGDVFGFIGPNGAGKTTTIRMLATLLTPSSGTIRVHGHDVVQSPLDVRKIIGYMPDFFGVYDDVKVWEYLDFFGAAYRIPRRQRPQVIDDVLELTDLTGKKEAYVEALSRGMKQRLCLAKTLMHDPEVLLLDEPASGLDPRARIEIRELLKELRRMGKTIFVSSHILSELADLCNTIGIIENGALLVAGDVQDIMAQVQGAPVMSVGVRSDPAAAVETLRDIAGVTVQSQTDSQIRFQYSGDADDLPEILAKLVTSGVRVSHFSEVETDLEDVFIQVTNGIVS